MQIAIYDRKNNESLLEYFGRLSENKAVYDLDYQEIYNLLFGEELSSDESRKRFYGMKDMYQKLKDEDVLNTDICDIDEFQKIEEKKQELKKVKYQISTLRNDLNKKIRESARHDLIVEEIKRIIPNAPEVEFYPVHDSKNKREYVLCISDIHYASFFTSLNNEYSIEILNNRFNKLFGYLVDFIDKNKVSRLHICNTGDSLQGIIRISDLKKNQIGLLESVVSFSRFMGDFLNQLSSYVNIKYYHVPTANHTEIRLFNNERNNSDENLEYIIINYIHDYLRNNNRVDVILPNKSKDFLEMELCGYNFILLHGHQVKSTKNLLSKLSMRNKKFYDYVIIGHFHSSIEETVNAGETNDKEILVIPSIVGSDPYADSIMSDSKSSAKLFVFEDSKGKIQSNTIILN